MDGVPKGGGNRPVDVVSQDNKPTAPGRQFGSVVDSAEKALPESEVDHDPKRLWERDAGTVHIKTDHAGTDQEWSSDDEDSAGDDSDDEGFADVKIPDVKIPDLNTLDIALRAGAGEDEDDGIIFADDDSSGIGSAPTTPGEDSDDYWAVPASTGESLPRSVSLGEFPDRSHANASEISSSNNDDAPSACETLVVRYSPQGPAKKPWIIRSRSIDASDEEAKEVYKADHHEALLLRSLSSDFIIGFIGFNGTIDTKDYTTELVLQDGGLNMAQATKELQDKKMPDELVPTMVSWLSDLARGLTVLKQNHILHRDIKPANLLVDMTANHLRIADFGNAHRVVENRFPSDASGTALYSAPEVRKNKRHYYSADIYSAGMSFVGIMLDADMLTVQTWKEFYQQNSTVTIAEPYCQHQSAPVLAALINKMIQKDPNQRPSAEKIVRTLQEHRLQS